MRQLLQKWLPTPNPSRVSHALPAWLPLPRDPRLWALRRHTVALGAAIGALTSVIPLPIQIPIAVLLAACLRAHVAAAAGASLLSNPLTIVPMWATAWKIGTSIAPATDEESASEWTFSFGADLFTPAGLLDAISAVGAPMLIGLPVLGAALALAAYAVVMLAWRFTGVPP